MGQNELAYPSANEYLTLDISPTDHLTNYYSCSGNTTIFTRKFDVYLDTDVINLDKGDVVKLKFNNEFRCTTKAQVGKYTNTGYTSTIKLSLGQDSYTNPKWVYKPWYRITHYPSTALTSTMKFVWDASKASKRVTLISGGTIAGSIEEQGVLSLVGISQSKNITYSQNPLNVGRFNKLTFLDIPSKDYVGPLKLVSSNRASNNWVQAVENFDKPYATPRITDYYFTVG